MMSLILAGWLQPFGQLSVPAEYRKPCGGATNCSLLEAWLSYNESHMMMHHTTMAAPYERHLPPRFGKGEIRLFEMGVQSGGSARMWKQWYGDRLHYVGADINPECKRSESQSENIYVEIGSQLDRAFLAEVCQKHGPFDIVVDDAAHRVEMIISALNVLWPNNTCMKQPSQYWIEDTHTMVMPKYTRNPADFYNIVGEAFWSMHHQWAYKTNAGYPNKQRLHPLWLDLVQEVHLYDSLILLMRNPHSKGHQFTRGDNSIGYGKGHPILQGKAALQFRHQGVSVGN